ncbi:MAG: OmpH family outer membrane protein [Pseudomonadota bacterium]|nr:OmpH family outer membrane protein [Pseudomonadota bacterium]
MRWIIAFIAAATINLAVAADKVAVVDMERALFLSDAATAAVKEFEKANQSDIDKLKSLQEDLMAAQKRVETEGDIMSDDQRRELKNEVEQKTQEYQFYGRKLQQLEEKWKRDLFNKQLPELEKTLKALIDEKGYDVVLNAQAVIFKSPEADITKLLLERLNAKK